MGEVREGPEPSMQRLSLAQPCSVSARLRSPPLESKPIVRLSVAVDIAREMHINARKSITRVECSSQPASFCLPSPVRKSCLQPTFTAVESELSTRDGRQWMALEPWDRLDQLSLFFRVFFFLLLAGMVSCLTSVG